jgi:hypothetical protein
MYDGFSDKGARSTEWFEITNNFLKLAFAMIIVEAKCPCNRCWNTRMLSEYEMSDHIAKNRFMSNYLVWYQHGEVQAPIAKESDGSDDENQMDNMIADIGMEYDLGYGDHHPPPEVHNFYRFLTALDEKVHDGTNLTVPHVVTRLMAIEV